MDPSHFTIDNALLSRYDFWHVLSGLATRDCDNKGTIIDSTVSGVAPAVFAHDPLEILFPVYDHPRSACHHTPRD